MAIVDVLRDDRAWKQGVRTAAAAAVSFLFAEAFSLPQGYWAVISAVLITQETMGATVQAVRVRLVGTFAGAAIGFLLAMVTPSGEWGTLVALVISTGWLAIFAVRYPSLRIAPMTAAIMLVAAPSHADVVVSAGHRVLEILIGCLIGIGVQLLVFPRRAETLLRSEVAEVLVLLAQVIVAPCDGANAALDGKLDEAFARLDAFGQQAEAERFGREHGGAVDADRVNHALRHLRIAVSGLHRVWRRALRDGDSHVAAGLRAVGEAIRAYLLELAAEFGHGGPTADSRRVVQAAARLPRVAPQGGSTADDQMVVYYGDALDQAKLALDQLRDAVTGAPSPTRPTPTQSPS